MPSPGTAYQPKGMAGSMSARPVSSWGRRARLNRRLQAGRPYGTMAVTLCDRKMERSMHEHHGEKHDARYDPCHAVW